MNNAKSYVTVLFYLFIFCIIVFVLSLIMLFARTGQETFFVQYGNVEITKTTMIAIPEDENIMFRPKRVFSDSTEYDVKIINSQTAPVFDFEVDGTPYSFKSKNDYSKAFTLRKYKDYFILYVESGLKMQTLLERMYEGKTITNVPDADLSADCYFSIEVLSDKGETVIINFRLEGGGT